MKCVLLSDTHGDHASLDCPDGDVLIHAGDFTESGGLEETIRFANWIENQPYDHKLVVAGNHERCLAPGAPGRPIGLDHLQEVATYLEDSSVTIDGTTIYGSPWTPRFGDWAFMKDESGLERTFSRIPGDTDVLVTHGPPRERLDTVTVHRQNGHGRVRTPTATKPVGSRALRSAVDRVAPEIHCFGHIHEGRGDTRADGTRFLNVSIMDESYDSVYDPVVVEIG